MKKVYCPYCHEEAVEDTTPTVIRNSLGFTYTCYKKICRNKAKHNSNREIVIPYKSQTKK